METQAASKQPSEEYIPFLVAHHLNQCVVLTANLLGLPPVEVTFEHINQAIKVLHVSNTDQYQSQE